MSDDIGHGDEATNAGAFNNAIGMRLRPRRSVLSDISNKIMGSISDATKKAVTSKKRKSSVGGNEIEPKKRLSTNATETSREPRIEVAAASSSSTAVSLNIVERKEELAAPEPGAATNAISSVAQPPLKRPRRSQPLYTKGSDPAQCLDIIDDMYDIYLENEDKYAAKNYMSTQKDINFKMRSILIDWLVEVHHKFKLFPSTLWLCVNILDRYLEKVSIMRSKLQLVGVTALFIACKFEEIYPPEVRDCVYITDYAYDREEVLKMETTILVELNWEILVPTGYHFLTRYLNCIRCSERTKNVAFYYAERNLQEQELLTLSPRKFAAAAVYAALKQQNTQYFPLRDASAWPKVLREETGLNEAEITPIASTMVRHVSEEPVTTSKRKLVATKKKYQADKYENTASLVLPTF